MLLSDFKELNYLDSISKEDFFPLLNLFEKDYLFYDSSYTIYAKKIIFINKKVLEELLEIVNILKEKTFYNIELNIFVKKNFAYEFYKTDKYFILKKYIIFFDENWNLVLKEDDNSFYYLNKVIKEEINKPLYQILKAKKEPKKIFPLSSFRQLLFDNDFNEIFYFIMLYNYNWICFKDLKINELKHIFLPFEECLKSYNKKQLIENMFNKKIKYNLNKLDLGLGISFAYFLDYVEEKDWDKLYMFCKSSNINNMSVIKVKYKRRRIEIFDILYHYFSKVLEIDETFIIDGIQMTLNLKKKLNLRITSKNHFIKFHDELVLEDMLLRYKARLKIGDNFKNLKLPKEFILLKNTKDIINEGIIQRHCVASYIPKINEGKCVIYTTIYNNVRYTIEIGCRKFKNKYKYKLIQIQGYKNGVSVPIELQELLNKELFKINNKIF